MPATLHARTCPLVAPLGRPAADRTRRIAPNAWRRLRAGAQLELTTPAGTALLAFADVELDLDRYELRRPRGRIPVEPQVFDVLVQLARNAHRVVTRQELLDTVWGHRFVSDSALTSRIKTARRSVGDDGRRQQIIATLHGRGYRIVVPVHRRPAIQRSSGRSLTLRSLLLLERLTAGGRGSSAAPS
jgi:DNA-binding winged helix-turn-helix (wHTH) protein